MKAEEFIKTKLGYHSSEFMEDGVIGEMAKAAEAYAGYWRSCSAAETAKLMRAEQENKELREDIRKIKTIMNYIDLDKMDAHYDFSFYDEDLTKINWVKQALKK